MADASTISPSSTLVTRRTTLDGFVGELTDAPGIYLRDLDPLTTLLVRTRNSTYRVIVSHGTSVLVQGGRFFRDATAARIDGSGFGGSLLKTGWIGVGFRMEIVADGERIITTPVREVTVDRGRPALLH
ncbi:MAG TPA: hypothetical protein VL693_16585 [Vicinamibacterales bacterium]|nr:hypothetical protein [Vicinamibacterales bacterium]